MNGEDFLNMRRASTLERSRKDQEIHSEECEVKES